MQSVTSSYSGGQVTGYADTPAERLTFLDTDTITFPNVAPSGESWDIELPAGTSLTVEVAADNTDGGGGRNPNNVTTPQQLHLVVLSHLPMTLMLLKSE